MRKSDLARLITTGGCALRPGGTASEVRGRVDALASALAARGVADGVPVGICAEPSAALVEAVLATLAAGGVAVPLDPGYPPARLATMGSAAELELVLCDAAGEDAAAGWFRGTALRLDRPIVPAPGRLRRIDFLAGCAYLLFTSGSTGVPKGVAMPAETIARLVGWQTAERPAGGASTLQFASPSFDVYFQEVLCAWADGSELVVAGPAVRRDAFALAELLAEAAVGRLFLPFIALQQLAAVLDAEPRPLPALTQVITAGEQLLATEPVRNLFRRNPAARLFNQYGPTETHAVTEHALPADPGTWAEVVPIGTPLPHVRVRLDGGELLVAGPVLAVGYLGDPELTAARFVVDAGGVRWYRTGDRAETTGDGGYRFLGRADGQVKVSGYRVEPAEVEVVLASLPEIESAAVVVQRSATGSATLAAFAVARPGCAPAPADVLGQLARRLPEYLVPRRLELVGQLPRTPSGKVDRLVLGSRLDPGPELVAGLICERLSASLRQPVDPRDDLWTIGADSVTAVGVAALLRQQWGVAVTVEELFDAESIEAVAALVTEPAAARG